MLAIAKEKIIDMPVASFGGRIIVVDNPVDCRSAMRYLLSQPIVGFDTETRPSFRKGQNNKVSLLQVSTFRECFLFRLHHTGLTPEMIKLFEDENIKKVGLSVKDDIHQLSSLSEFTARNVVELQTYVKEFEINDNALQKIYAIIFGEKISKGQRLSNWEAETLTEPQKQYAALDAYACIKLYKYLQEGNFNPADSPYQVVEPEEPATEQ